MYDFSAVQKLLESFVRIGPPGCGMQVSLAGEEVFSTQVGYADLERHLPIKTDTLFRMCSNTKLVTAVAAMILFERGAFLLDDPVADYMPCFSKLRCFSAAGNGVGEAVPLVRPLTIRHLLTMTAGIPYAGTNTYTQRQYANLLEGFLVRPDCTLQELAERICEIPIEYQPGDGWCYGMGMDLIGALIEVISGKSFGAFLKDELFDPLEMRDTVFTCTPEQRERLAVLYMRNARGELVPNASIDFAYAPGYRYESGGAGLLSTVADMERLSRMLCMGGTLNGRRILGKASISLMSSDHLTGQARLAFSETWDHGWDFLRGYSYGLGVRTMRDPAIAGSGSPVGEFGWAGAAGTWTLIDTEHRLSVFYAHQLMPENMEGYCHRRLKNAVYAALNI